MLAINILKTLFETSQTEFVKNVIKKVLFFRRYRFSYRVKEALW